MVGWVDESINLNNSQPSILIQNISTAISQTSESYSHDSMYVEAI